MKLKIVKAIALLLAMICILWVPVSASAVSQGTDGTELQVMKPQKLEIHLGESWAGVEFELETDVGMYPGTIPVGEDGVLRLEIGGSENYILSCLNSTVAIPKPGENQTASEETVGDTVLSEGTVTTEISGEADSNRMESLPDESEQGSVAGIPIAHIAMLGGGLIVSICTLAGIQFFQKRRGRIADSDDDI